MTPGDAATVLLLDDTADGLAVFMLERHIDSDFVGGAFVFPGGKVDEADRTLPAGAVSGDPDARLVDAVGADTARALVVAAIRETFEECGVLLADRTPSDTADARIRMNDRSGWDWTDWLLGGRVRLDLSALTWWSWWVTPAGVHRRYDTKFFVAERPNGAHADHDKIETTDSVWVRPSVALSAAAAGTASIIFPTRKNLERLATHASVAEAIAAARSGEPPERIEPTVTRDGEGRLWVTHPAVGSEPI